VRSFPCLAFSNSGWWPSSSSPAWLHDLSNRAPSPQGAVLWIKEKDKTYGITITQSLEEEGEHIDAAEWRTWQYWQESRGEGGRTSDNLTWCKGERWYQIWFAVCHSPLPRIYCPLCYRNAWAAQCTETWDGRKRRVRLFADILQTGCWRRAESLTQ